MFASKLTSIREDNPDATYYMLMRLLDSHDTKRILWSLTPGENNREDKEFNPDNLARGKELLRLAVAIQMKSTIYDLEESELCYAPQFGSAKDAVNFAGMIAADVLHGDMPLAHWEDTKGAFLLDVRHPVELVVESVPGAVNIPLNELRARLAELPRDREVRVICRSAQRAYYATRILLQNRFKAQNTSGGMLARAMRSLTEVK